VGLCEGKCEKISLTQEDVQVIDKWRMTGQQTNKDLVRKIATKMMHEWEQTNASEVNLLFGCWFHWIG